MDSSASTHQDDWQTRLLPFQRGVFATLVEEADCLVVLARGLGLDRLLVSLLRLYCDPRVLVVVLNVDSLQRTLLMEELALAGLSEGAAFLRPAFVNTDTPPEERRDMYLRGGGFCARFHCTFCLWHFSLPGCASLCFFLSLNTNLLLSQFALAHNPPPPQFQALCSQRRAASCWTCSRSVPRPICSQALSCKFIFFFPRLFNRKDNVH